LISSILFVSAPFAIELVGGPQFAPSVDVLRILAVGAPATFLVAVWAFALLSLRRYRELIVANAVIVVVAVALCLVLIPPLGAKGAATVTASLEVILAGGYAFALTRADKELRPRLERVPRIALAFAPAFALALILPVHPVAAAVIGVLTFALLLKLLRVLPEELFEAVLHRRRPAGGVQ